MNPARPDSSAGHQRDHRPPPLQQQASYGTYNPATSPPITPQYQANGMRSPNNYQQYGQAQQQQQPTPTNGAFRRESYTSQQTQQSQQQAQRDYNPNTYGQISPPAHQQYFSPPPTHSNQQYSQYQPPSTSQYPQQQQQPQPQQYASQQVPAGWQPPPPPPGPPPSHDYAAMQAAQYPAGPGGYAQDTRRSGQTQGGGDPWAGLSAWK